MQSSTAGDSELHFPRPKNNSRMANLPSNDKYFNKNSSILKIEKRKNAESNRDIGPQADKVYDSSFVNDRPRTRQGGIFSKGQTIHTDSQQQVLFASYLEPTEDEN